MRVLKIPVGRHPEVIDIGKGLQPLYEAINCDTIQITYPWDDLVGLVCDEEGKFDGQKPNRCIPEIHDIIHGDFLICGLGYEDLTDLSAEFIKKYREMFWWPEVFVEDQGVMHVIRMVDGTMP